MSKRDTMLLLEDMRESALKIRKYTDGLNYESFIADEKTIDATARNISVIGEAANRIDPEFRLQNPEIEWRRIRGLRNRIIHDYFGIDLEIVWSIIEYDLIGLIDQLEELIDKHKLENPDKN